MTNICEIPVSIGELYDKYTILQIKSEEIKDESKLKQVYRELDYLQPHIDRFVLPTTFYNEMKCINKELWDIEDDIRTKESLNEFDADFIELARSVYKRNDQRAKIKQSINVFFKSAIYEVKSYVHYDNTQK